MVMVTQAVPHNEHLIHIHPSIPAELSFKLVLFNGSLPFPTHPAFRQRPCTGHGPCWAIMSSYALCGGVVVL
jgi:hypothetical protein